MDGLLLGFVVTAVSATEDDTTESAGVSTAFRLLWCSVRLGIEFFLLALHYALRRFQSYSLPFLSLNNAQLELKVGANFSFNLVFLYLQEPLGCPQHGVVCQHTICR